MSVTSKAVKERPIIFSGPMVKAILAGRKAQTRRVVKPQPEVGVRHFGDGHHEVHVRGKRIGRYASGPVSIDVLTKQAAEVLLDECPYGFVGERLWVREAFAGPMRGANVKHEWRYRADDDEQVIPFRGSWRSPIHMPRWASRLTLEITSVRIERLHAITEDDALADGGWLYSNCPIHKSPTRSFAAAWDRINGKKHPWSSNCWVWVLSFKVVQPSPQSRLSDECDPETPLLPDGFRAQAALRSSNGGTGSRPRHAVDAFRPQ